MCEKNSSTNNYYNFTIPFSLMNFFFILKFGNIIKYKYKQQLTDPNYMVVMGILNLLFFIY